MTHQPAMSAPRTRTRAKAAALGPDRRAGRIRRRPVLVRLGLLVAATAGVIALASLVAIAAVFVVAGRLAT